MLLAFLATTSVGASGLPQWHSSEAQIKRELLSNYGDSYIRPGRAASASDCTAVPAPPDSVHTQFHVDRYHLVDELAESFGFDGYLRTWWHDPRLSFGSHPNASCAGLSKLSLTRAESRLVWRPQLYWERALRIVLPTDTAMVGAGAGELFEISPEGFVFWSQQTSATLACDLDLSKMPFDTQRCRYKMGLYSFTADEVTLRWKTGRSALGAWNSSSTCRLHELIPSQLEQENTIDRYEYDYTYVTAHVSFTRQAYAVLISFLMPAIVMVAVSMLGFYIDPSAMNARVALGVITLIVVINNFIALRSRFPTGEETWLSRLLLVSFGFNVLAFCEQVAVTFGIQIGRWLDQETKRLTTNRTWTTALKRLGRDGLERLFHEWDADGSGNLSKAEFRAGVSKLHLGAAPEDVNRLFDKIDVRLLASTNPRRVMI